MRPVRRAAGPLLAVALAGVLAACGGGGFGSKPPTPDQTIHSYVALGDGYTAAPYTGRTVGHDGCLRSAANYPALVAEQLGIKEVRDVSCTGVTTRALTESTKPANGHPAVSAQLDAVHADTGLVTIGMGIEDQDILDNMFRVCLTLPCPLGTIQYTKVLDAVDSAAEAVTSAVRAIQAKAPGAYVVVVGYPRLTPPPDGACGAYPAQPPVTVDAMNYVIDDINGKLQSTARQTGSGWVDVASVSADHVLCSKKPWIHTGHTKPGKVIAYHPLAAEQRAVADQVVTVVRQR